MRIHVGPVNKGNFLRLRRYVWCPDSSVPLVLNLKLSFIYFTQAFQDLQIKMVSTTQQLKMSDMQIDQLRRQNTHAKLVESELAGLPDSTKVYQGVGRM